jgi:predicted enzyme related to lactoylglutathione lyase
MARLPTITAPVSRHVFVTDIDRSVAFYRDVVGFATQPVREEYGAPADVELTLGAARLQLGRRLDAPSRAILFFETNDVDAMRDAIVARQGSPSEIASVNWIKMRMFEVRDPDGHTMWFGQSFGGPNVTVSSPMMRTIIPELPFDDVAAGVAHYRDVLGFSVNYAQDDIGIMDRDKVRVALIARTERHTGIGSCYVYVRDADALHAELRARGAKVLGEPVSMPWGLRQFEVVDLAGNRITFGQTFE